MSDFMTHHSGPFFVDTPDGEKHEFERRIDLWNFLNGMTRDVLLLVVVRTGFAMAKTVMREDDGDYVHSLLEMEANCGEGEA